LRTKPVTSPFGVGGPDLPDPPSDTAPSTQSTERHTEAAADDDSITAGARKDQSTADADTTHITARHRKGTATATDPATPLAADGATSPDTSPGASPEDQSDPAATAPTDQSDTATTGPNDTAKDKPAAA
jgi:hypothetical protein